jgi:hypothetical protein
MKIPMGKARPVDKPYKIFQSDGWEWRVLKAYQTPEKEKTNQYARWYCAVKSPFTFGSWEYGDTYIADIDLQAICTYDEFATPKTTTIEKGEYTK